jgi:drug/metabolite transporter (DMT)-like permease
MNQFARQYPRPAAWAVLLAFTVLYLSWGTTYLAIRIGVHDEHMPPCLFAGCRVASAGAILLGYLCLRGQARLRAGELLWVALSGVLLFVFGNGGLTIAEDKVASGTAAVLGATTPLWIGLIETFWPDGDRLTWRGWCGLFGGLAGVFLLVGGQLQSAVFGEIWAMALVLASSLAWAVGSLVVRHRRHGKVHLAAAAYQMVIGGGALALAGLAVGEGSALAKGSLTLKGIEAFLYLLVVGSLLGFVAFNWLLSHVSAAMVGTHAYVNPVIAILVGWLLAGEPLAASLIAGMVVILAGVCLVRGGIKQPAPARDAEASKQHADPEPPVAAVDGVEF